MASSYYYSQGLGVFQPDLTTTNSSANSIANIYSSNLSVAIGSSNYSTSTLSVTGGIYSSTNISTAQTLAASNILLNGNALANISDSNWITTSNAAFAALSSTNSNVSSQWSVNSSNNLFTAYTNVGIGTSNPTTTLQVNGAGQFTSAILAGGSNATGLTLVNTPGQIDIAISAMAGQYAPGMAAGDFIIKNDKAGSKIMLQNGGAGPALCINGSNNVGISMSNPTYGLDCAVQARFANGIVVGDATENLAINDNNSYQILGGAVSAMQDAASINLSGRNRSGGGALAMTATDNAYISFNTITSSGTGTEYMRMTGGGQIAIGTTVPTSGYLLDVNGAVHSSSNIVSKSGTVGYSSLLFWGYENMSPANGSITQPLYLEPGNPGLSGSMFNSGFLISGNDGSGELTFNRARLRIRGCTLNTNTTASTYSASVRCYNSNAGAWTTLKTWNLSDTGSYGGYVTAVSPWFSLTNTNMPVLGLSMSNVVSSANPFRLGPTYIDFSY